jgi:membrane dipeptidase
VGGDVETGAGRQNPHEIAGVHHVGIGTDQLKRKRRVPRLDAQGAAGREVSSTGQDLHRSERSGKAGLDARLGQFGALMEVGFSEAETAKIMGGNWLRLYENVMG